MAAEQFGPHNFQLGKYYEISTPIYLNGGISVHQHIYGKIAEIRSNSVIFGISKVINDPNGRRQTFNYESRGGSQRLYSDMLSVRKMSSNEYSQIPPITPPTGNMDGGKRRLRKTKRASKKQRKHKKRVHTKRR